MTGRVPIVQFGDGKDLLPWLESLAARANPRLSERSLAGVLNTIQVAAMAHGLLPVPRDELMPDNAIILEDEHLGTTFAVFVHAGHIDVQSWNKTEGRTLWARIDTKRRPGGTLPPGGEVSA